LKPEHEPKSDFTFLKKGPGTGFWVLFFRCGTGIRTEICLTKMFFEKKVTKNEGIIKG
jgi:hypothetical protein